MKKPEQLERAYAKELRQQLFPLFDEVERRKASLPALVLAVSGGCDSMALLHLTRVLPDLDPTRLLIAHFDHALRPESHLDRQFVQKNAEYHGLPYRSERWQPPDTSSGNLAEQCRKARYRFLGRCAKELDAGLILTAHHRDDQAETFLLRLLRGSGLTGLGAIHPKRPLHGRSHLSMSEQAFSKGQKQTVSENPDPAHSEHLNPIELVRPLLPFRKETLRRWLIQRGHTWREDPSNRSVAYQRNRIRHHLLPFMESNGDAQAVEKLAATAERLQQSEQALSWMTRHLEPELKITSLPGPALALCHRVMADLPEELALRMLIRLHRRLSGDIHPPGEAARQQFLSMLKKPGRHWEMRMRGLKISREDQRLILTLDRSNATEKGKRNH